MYFNSGILNMISDVTKKCLPHFDHGFFQKSIDFNRPFDYSIILVHNA